MTDKTQTHDEEVEAIEEDLEEDFLADILSLTLDKIQDISSDAFEIKIRQLKKGDHLKLLKKLFALLKEATTQKYRNLPWEKIEEEFYADKDIKRRYILIKAFITQNAICHDRKCFTFLNLDPIAKQIDALPLGCYDLETAKTQFGENSQNYKDFEEIIRACSKELNESFQEIHRIFSMKNARDKAQEDAQRRIIERMDIMGKHKIPQWYEFNRDIDKQFKEDESILSPDSPELKKRPKYLENKGEGEEH